MFFLSVHCMNPRDNFLEYLTQVLADEFEAFLHSSVLDKAIFC